MSLTNHVAIFVMAHVAAYAGTGLAFMLLSWASFFDVPNERSSHSGPIPRGAGLALTPLAAAAVAGVGIKVAGAPPESLVIAGLAVALGVVSWIDDRRGLSAACPTIRDFLDVRILSSLLIRQLHLSFFFQLKCNDAPGFLNPRCDIDPVSVWGVFLTLDDNDPVFGKCLPAEQRTQLPLQVWNGDRCSIDQLRRASQLDFDALRFILLFFILGFTAGNGLLVSAIGLNRCTHQKKHDQIKRDVTRRHRRRLDQ